MECSRCVYKKEFSICNNEKSPFYNQKVEEDNSCDFFKESEALNHLANANLLSMQEKDEDAMKEFQLAIKFGLPRDREAYSRSMLGSIYFENNRFSEGIDEIEKSLFLDKEGNFGMYQNEDEMRLGFLSQCSAACILKLRQIKKESGLDSAIAFVQEKMNLVDYLPGKYMPGLHYELAQLYLGKAQEKYDSGEDEPEVVNAAISSLKNCLDAEYDENSDTQLKYRQMAEEGLQNIEKMKAEEGTKGKKGLCFIATAVYGSTNDPNVLLLKNYRDGYLIKYAIGNWLINRYYELSPYAAKIIKRSYVLRQIVKITFIDPIVSIIRAFIAYK